MTTSQVFHIPWIGCSSYLSWLGGGLTDEWFDHFSSEYTMQNGLFPQLSTMFLVQEVGVQCSHNKQMEKYFLPPLESWVGYSGHIGPLLPCIYHSPLCSGVWIAWPVVLSTLPGTSTNSAVCTVVHMCTSLLSFHFSNWTVPFVIVTLLFSFTVFRAAGTPLRLARMVPQGSDAETGRETI